MSLKYWLLILFNLAYIVGFTFYYISIGNFEFLGYIGLLVILFLLVVFTYKRTRFKTWILWALSAWGLMHMLGGSIRVYDRAIEYSLYHLTLIPIWVTDNFYILKVDQIVHFYLYLIVPFLVWHLWKDNINRKHWLAFIGVMLISMGIGALNEIVEFTTVLLFDSTGVGGYYNNAWDLVFNTLGAVVGTLIIWFKEG